MTSDRARLSRARLMERVRSVEQRKAADQAFRAEVVREKLEHLSERTRSLAQLYDLRDHAEHAADLHSASVLATHLRDLGNTAARQAEQARRASDERLAELVAAERRRQRAEEGRRELHRALLEQLGKPEGVPMRKTGTHLE